VRQTLVRSPGDLLALVLTAAALIPIWATTYFPSQNGPWFLLPSHMYAHYYSPEWNYSEFYIRNLHPIPHMLHDVLVAGLSTIIPLLTAEKLVLSLYVILVPVSVFYLLSSVAPGNKRIGILSVLMILSYPFMRGYHDFTLSVPLFFIALAYWHRHRESLGQKNMAVLAMLSALVYLSHLFTFALLVGCIGWIRLWETRNLWQAFVASALSTWPGWLLCLHFVWLNSQATWIKPHDTSWLPFHWRVEYFVREYFYTVSGMAYVLSVLAWMWCVVFLVRVLCLHRKDLRLLVFRIVGNPFASLVLFLLMAYFILPYKMIGWHKVNTRLVPFILVLGLAAIGQSRALFPSGRRSGLLFESSVAVAMVASIAFMTAKVIEMDRCVQEYVTGVDKFESNSKLLAIHTENSAFGQIRPITRAHEYYHVYKGGANGHGLGKLNTLAMMWYRQYPLEQEFPQPQESMNEADVERMERAYDFVLVWGQPQDCPEWLSRSNFVSVHQKGRLRLYQYRTAKREEEVAAR
jgi:hypothetical protein